MQKENAKPKSELGGVVVLDFGGQYTQLIARRIREQQVFSAILPCSASVAEIRSFEPAGIVLSGGPSSVYDQDAPKCDPAVLAAGIPVLGICYGMQWISSVLGGTVEPVERREYGRAEFQAEFEGDCPELFKGLPVKLKIWNSHGDSVLAVPGGFRTTGKTENAIAAMEDTVRKIHAVQFHPEGKSPKREPAIAQLPVSGLQSGAKWSEPRFHRRNRCEHPPEGRHQTCHLRSEWRRRFYRRSRPGSPRHRGFPNQHLCEQWPLA